MSLDLEQFHDVFFQESFEALDAMEQTLLQLNDQSSDPEHINTIFRVAHSIKGGAGMLGAAAVMTSAWDLEVAIAGREGSAAVQARLEAVRAALAALAAAMP